MSYFITVTRPTESARDTRWCYSHPGDKRMQLSPFPEPIPTYEEAQIALTAALDWWSLESPGWVITLEGPDGAVMSTHTLTTRLSLAKPAHPNLFTNH